VHGGCVGFLAYIHGFSVKGCKMGCPHLNWHCHLRVGYHFSLTGTCMMRRVCLALLGLLGILVTARAIPQGTVQSDIPTEKLVNTLRLLNTEEYEYRHETGRFAAREEMLTFLRTKGLLSQAPTDLSKPPRPRFFSQQEMSTSLQTKEPSPIDLENPKPYELTITTSSDGMHYQITLKRPSDTNDESTWCKTASFSDDSGLIFLGSALDCAAPVR
jgi:hypothetical protein